jgi:hypothetical protein
LERPRGTSHALSMIFFTPLTFALPVHWNLSLHYVTLRLLA